VTKLIKQPVWSLSLLNSIVHFLFMFACVLCIIFYVLPFGIMIDDDYPRSSFIMHHISRRQGSTSNPRHSASWHHVVIFGFKFLFS